MHLIEARVGPFKSINEPQTVLTEKNVTVFVGMNEAGKTVFLQALQKSRDAMGAASFDPVEDYPRKDLATYQKQHKTKPEQVTALTYELTTDEIAEINDELGADLRPGFTFSVSIDYANNRAITINVDESALLKKLASDKRWSSDTGNAVKKAKSVREIPNVLSGLSITESDQLALEEIKSRISKSKWSNKSVLEWEVYDLVRDRIPQFLYFGEYEILPSKINLAELARRAGSPNAMDPEHKAVLALLRMADISLDELANPEGYESLKAKIEAVSISLTDQIMEFWKQNEELEVEIDIKPDSTDAAPFNSGANLYIRIKNRRHRGVSTPFRHRSRGFIWFFSFLVWFDSVKHQLGKNEDDLDLILLLDEPGLNLHALAQNDFMRYIEDLGKRHQVLYTTHSPFMIDPTKLGQVRLVEDKKTVGTVITDTTVGSDARTVFPLQAALGYSIAQSLFISKKNLLVEGPSELIYLKALSQVLESKGRTGMREDVTIVPTGGLDKVVTFISLLGANGLEIVVLHDFRGKPEQKLTDLIRRNIVREKKITNPSRFRDLEKIGQDSVASDIEDLFTKQTYLSLFNSAFASQLKKKFKISDLPAEERIVRQLELLLESKNINIRPSGGFNHYKVAAYLASNPLASYDDDTLDRFEAMFKAINALFSEAGEST